MGLGRAVPVALLWLLALVLWKTAWVCDDAYISFRVLDNAASGLGLRWNPLERVQVFTHPLWLLLLLPIYAITGEIWLTSMAVGASLSLATASMLAWAGKDNLSGSLSLLALSTSAAYVDFSTSGLENPLAHVLLAAFVLLLPGRHPALVLLAGLVGTNRLDHLLLVAPATAWLLWRTPRAVAGLAPVLGWLVFAVIYYGTPAPSTALAKLGAGIPAGELAVRGLWYLYNSLTWDPVTLTVVGLGLAGALFGSAPQRLAMLGVALYLLYVIEAGGDHMSGRFLTAPFVMSLAVLLQLRIPTKAAVLGTVFLLGLGSMARNPPLLSGPDLYLRELDPRGIVDERGFYYVRTGLLAPGVYRDGPAKSWAEEAREAREVEVREMVGFYGYYAGPGVHIVDPLGLGDPLLARLPMEGHPEWRTGHYFRRVPEGWPQAAIGKGRLEDPDLARFWERLAVIVRGPVWSWERAETMWALYTGQLQPRLQAWCDRANRRWEEDGRPYVAPCRQ